MAATKREFAMDRCSICGKSLASGEGCICQRVALKSGTILERQRHAQPPSCQGCGVHVGELHHFQCPHEICPSCGDLLLGCGCM
jgi:hypothetical protein